MRLSLRCDGPSFIKVFIAVLLFAMLAVAVQAQTIRYVKQGGAGSGSGDSWGNASGNVQDMINAAAAGDEVWVAAGEYQPASGHSFSMKEGVKLYGGFSASGEPTVSDRNWAVNATTLRGNGGRVVISSGLTAASLLDGFTITGGHDLFNGGGMIFVNSSATLVNCIIESNTSGGLGGGINNVSSSPTLTNVIIRNNSAGQAGGGMLNGGSSKPVLTNVTIVGNSATVMGGGMDNFDGSRPVLNNCIVWGNNVDGATETTSASISNASGAIPAIAYSLIANSGGSSAWNAALGANGGGNIDADPGFTDIATGNYTLSASSPAVNAGNNVAYTGVGGSLEIDLDLAGYPRVFGGTSGTIDLGAYEYQGDPAPVFIPGAGNVLYVNQTVSGGSGSGDSWSNAIPELADALKWAKEQEDRWTENPLQIWVAKGLYLPANNGIDRGATFRLVNGVKVYGGFSGSGQPTMEQRDWTAHSTILSGDIDGNDLADIITEPETQLQGANTRQVVTGSGTNATAVLDGFTITAGWTVDTDGPNFPGAGFYNDNGSPTLANLAISGNQAYVRGGGLYNKNSSPSLTNVVISGNRAAYGGGVYNDDSNPTLMNVVISGNTAGPGGGLYNENSSPILTNVIISGNAAATNGYGFGGGIFNDANSIPTLTNVTISGNTAVNRGGGMSNNGSGPVLNNAIIWGNSAPNSPNVSGNATYTYSLVQGMDPIGAGNLPGTAAPLFVDERLAIEAPTTGGDYRLREGSPTVNAGNPGTDLALFPGGPDAPVDLAGHARIQYGAIDLGAYESMYVRINPGADDILYVNQAVSGSSGSGDSWDNAVPELADALDWAADNWDAGENGALQIWVAAGNYRPAAGGSFSMVEGVHLYGGFPASDNPTMAQRDWTTYVTTLSGNGSRVITNNGNKLTPTTVLDGFTITGGDAGEGGGVYNYDSSPAFTNVTISGNTAGYGGGVYNYYNSSPVLTNVTISGNRAANDGGGMYNITSSHTVLTNVTISGNTATAGGGIYNVSSSYIELRNSVIWGNSSGVDGDNTSTIRHAYNLVQGLERTDDGNLSSEGIAEDGSTIFVNPVSHTNAPTTDGDYALRATSPTINAGNPDTDLAIFPGSPGNPVDQAGNPRVYDDGIIDLGAYEYQGEPVLPITPGEGNILYVKKGGTGRGSAWNDAVGELADALRIVKQYQSRWTETNPLHIWVAAGEYQPAAGKPFSMVKNVKIYGGFAASGDPTMADRNWRNYETTLRGNGNGVVYDIDNGHTYTTVLDGFTVTGGTAPIAGGLATVNSSSILTNLTISGNISIGVGGESGGGGVVIINSSPILTNVTIIGNNSVTIGGGLYNTGSSPILTNVTISGNKAALGGDGMMNYESSPFIRNSIIWGNGSSNIYNLEGGGIATSSNHNIIEGPDAVGNIPGIPEDLAAEDIFVDSANGNYRLKFGSMAANAGSNGVYDAGQTPDLSGIGRDLDGNPRIQRGTVDIGAYESPYVMITALGGIQPIAAPFGTALNDIPVPDPFTVEATLSDGTTVEVALPRNPGSWTLSAPAGGIYDGNVAGNYSFEIAVEGDEAGGYGNPLGLKVTVQVVVGKGVPLIVWDTPEAIAYGTALSTTQLNATADVAGTFTYGPAEGAVLPPGMHALEVTFEPEDADNYHTATATVQLTVDKAQPIITADLVQRHVYDGTAKSVEAKVTPDELAEGLQYSPQRAFTEAGDHRVRVYLNESANYLGAEAWVDFTVAPASQQGLTLPDRTVTYDGQSHSLDVQGLAEDATVVYAGNGQVIAGSHEVTALVSRPNHADTALTGTLYINKATAVITAEEVQEHVYDGTAKSVQATLNHGETALAFTPQQAYTSAGNYNITVSAPETANYHAAGIMVTLRILPAGQNGLTLPDLTVTYDGQAHGLSVQGLAGDATVAYTIDGEAVDSATDAGVYEVVAVVSRPDYADATLTATLTINRARAFLLGDENQVHTYDGTAKALEVTLSHGEAVLSFDPSRRYTAAGTYPVTVSAQQTRNYQAVSKTFTLRVDPATITGLALESATYTYDGRAKALVLTGTPPEGTEVSYTTDGVAGNSATQAGTYLVIATVSGADYASFTDEATLTIGKAQPVVTADPTQSHVYDGRAKAVAATVAPAGLQSQLQYSPQRSFMEVGQHRVRVYLNESANYLPTETWVDFSISPAPQQGITLPERTVTYDGRAHSLSVEGLSPDATVVYTGNGQTEAGSHTVSAVVSRPNYEPLVLTSVLTISRAEAFILGDENQVYTYDGTAKTLEATLSHGEAALSFSPRRDYTAAGTYPITVSAPQTRNYRAVSRTFTLRIAQAARVLNFPELPEKTYGDADFDPSALPSTRETVVYTSSNPEVAEIVDGRIRIIGAGTAVITATLPENSNYSSSPVVSRELVVHKAPQTLTLEVPSEVNRDAGSIPLNVSTSSGLPVSLSLDDEQVATLEGTVLNILRLGTVHITATQAGDANHEAAEPVTVTVRVVDPESDFPVRVHPAVSPNGDGINEYLIIEGIKDYPENRVSIFNRNGTVVWEADGYDNDRVAFRGIGTGQNRVPAGTYFYVVEVKVNGTWEYHKGYFVLRY